MAAAHNSTLGGMTAPSPGPATLRINLFGCPRVIRTDAPEPVSLGRPAHALLAFLLLRGHQLHPREKLAYALWSGATRDAAAHSLRTTLWRLRRAIEPPEVPKGTYLLVNSRGEVGFNWNSRYWLDVLDFETTIRHADAPVPDSALEKLEQALRLYEGGLLEGFYDDWILRERERLRNLYIQGLSQMMWRLKDEQRYEGALEYGRKILQEDPLRESVHRQMMRLHALNGNRCQALMQYEELALMLEEQLEVAPSEETTSVYAQILRMEARTGGRVPVPAGHPPASMRTRELQRCLTDLEECKALLARAHENLRTLAVEVVERDIERDDE